MRSTAALGAGGEVQALGLLPLCRGIVGIEQVRAELAVRDAGEIAAASGIAHRVLHDLAGKSARGHLERSARFTAQDRPGPFWYQSSNSVMLILPRIAATM
jgi:hypothetical protein